MAVMRKKISYILLLLSLLVVNSCIEEFNPATTEFEDSIVIEATLTNQLKFQKVLLSRTFKIDDFQLNPESGANVRIVSNSTIYTFTERSPGEYISDIQFKAEIDTDYELLVTSNNGNEYRSEVTQLRSETSNVEEVYAVREVNENGVNGVSIYLDSYDPTGDSRYYTYNFEETYQIIPPFWSSDEFRIISENPFRFGVFPRLDDARECYNTINSTGRLVTNTNLLSEDRVSQFLITFIPDDDIKVSSRYSILVRQYTNTRKAYDFHKTLNELSTSDNVFSAVQPGFVAGNIVSTTNVNEKVVGFFEVTAVEEKRIFFNREDVLGGAYDWGCEEFTPPIPPSFLSLQALVRADKISYVVGGDGEPFIVVDKRCGDCTLSGSSTKPNFWID